MRLLSVAACMRDGHIWGDSASRPGIQVCRRCYMRRRDPWAGRLVLSAQEPCKSEVGATALRTIAVIARKGGVGKTTLALQLTIAAHLRGRLAVLADADFQRSASESMRGRGGRGPRHVETSAGSLANLQAQAVRLGVHYLIVDTPGGDGGGPVPCAALSDLVLLVARPNFLDIAAAVRMLGEVREVGRPALIVLNQAPPARAGQEHRTVAKAVEALRFTNLPLSPVVMHARTAYQTAVATGRSVEEMGPSAAAEETAALWSYLEGQLADEPQRALA